MARNSNNWQCPGCGTYNGPSDGSCTGCLTPRAETSQPARGVTITADTIGSVTTIEGEISVAGDWNL